MTPRETRRLLEGRRVHNKIQNMMNEAYHDAGGDMAAASRALGRRVPRPSDERMLRDYADKMQRGEVTRAKGVRK